VFLVGPNDAEDLLSEALFTVLRRLSAQQRAVVFRVHRLDLDAPATAQRLGVSVAPSKRQLARSHARSDWDR
jgi:DNA-directed RNA polymerase specialized sigma24 family protein